MFLMKHLVKHDVFNKEARNKITVERRVYANELVLDTVRTHFDRTAYAVSSTRRTPRNVGTDGPIEVATIYLVVNLLEIVYRTDGHETDASRWKSTHRS